MTKKDSNEERRQHLMNTFFKMVDSLKKSRRADLSDINDDSSIIEKLYVDPLENNFVLNTTLNPNTTILIGRKGTGKSTIIARLQHEIRKSKDKLSLYLDVKAIFDQSRTFNYSSEGYSNILNKSDLDKYFLFKSFLKLVISQIEEEVKTNTLKFFLANISDIFGPNKEEFKNEINNIFSSVNTKSQEDILILKEKLINANESQKDEHSINSTTELSVKTKNLSPDFGLSSKISESDSNSNSANLDEKFSEILMQYYEPFTVLNELKKLLKKIGIKYVFICLDDFSEIDESAMKVFVDTIVAPLNNWSEEFFKFKIAGYPGRVYLGDIDPTKIEQIKLDYYDLYISSRVTDTQQEAINSIKRLLTKRCKYFCDASPESFFSHNDKYTMDNVYRTIFEATSNVPRNIGWILWYAYQSSISKGKKITNRDLLNASERYYVDSIEVFFSKNKYMREAFKEKLEKYHLHELLNKIINSAKQNRAEIAKSDSKIFKADRQKPPTSHFYVEKGLESVLKTLELNFFITKYSEQKAKEARIVMTFYTLNHGLCQMEDIIYGKGSDRKYVVQRRFEYSDILREYIATAKQFVCNKCNATFAFEMKANLELFDMMCPNCKKGTCSLEHIQIELPKFDEDKQLQEVDLNLISSLKIDEPQYPSALAQEIDCTYQKVSRRASKLEQKGLIRSEKLELLSEVGRRTYYFLTDKAKKDYFD